MSFTHLTDVELTAAIAEASNRLNEYGSPLTEVGQQMFEVDKARYQALRLEESARWVASI